MISSLLIKRYKLYLKCMKEEILIIVILAQKSRQNVGSCGMKQRRISPAERDRVWMGAVKKDMLLIFYVITISQVTSRGGIVSPGHCFSL